MGYTSEKKNKRSNKNNNSLSNKLLTFWKEKRPFVIFVSSFISLMILFYIFWLTAFFENNIQPTVVSINTAISNFILNLLGQKTQHFGSIISNQNFSINLKRGCDAIEAMALFASALISFPMIIKQKLRGLLIGILILFVLNTIRIVSLFLVGIYYPNIFELMHVEIWQIIFILFALGIFISLIQKGKKIKHVTV